VHVYSWKFYGRFGEINTTIYHRLGVHGVITNPGNYKGITVRRSESEGQREAIRISVRIIRIVIAVKQKRFFVHP